MKHTLTTDDSQKAFEEACALRNYDPVAVLPDVSNQPEWMQRFTLSTIKRVIIAEAINDGRVRKPGKETVYFPVWDLTDNRSGFGFSYTSCADWAARTVVGSRLEFFSREDAEFFGTNFMDLHKDVVTISQ